MSQARRRIEVAAAVLFDEAGRFLLAQRPSGKAFEGYWEFPGGKVEPGESAADALRRELDEELGITVDTVYPWLTRDFEYPHASVQLRFFRVYQWRGELQGREGQRFAWQTGTPHVEPILPANGPILRALMLPPVYGITQAHSVGLDIFKRQLTQALEGGLKLIQVREKELSADVLRQLAMDVVALARPFEARVLINNDVQLVRDVGADGVHLTAAMLGTLQERPDCAWVAASCHNRDELAAAQRLGADFVVMGPVMATPTHPGAPALGWDAFAHSIEDLPMPVYALGGMQMLDAERARLVGAHGLAMLRGAWV